MIRLTRRRVLAALAAIGGGTILGNRAVSVARGTAGTAVPNRWHRHPHVHPGSHGPVLEFDSLEAGRSCRLVVYVADDGRSRPLRITGTLTPPTITPEDTLLRVTDAGEVAVDPPAHGSEVTPGAEWGDGDTDERRVEDTPSAWTLTTRRRGDTRTRRLVLEWGYLTESDGVAIPNRLELRFESGWGSESDQSGSGTDSVNRFRTTAKESGDVVRFPTQFSPHYVKRDGPD